MHSSQIKVEVFILDDCPISREYAPEIQRIARRFSGGHVSFTLVHEDPDAGDERAKSYAREFGYSFGYVIDPIHAFARAAHVSNVPAVAVYKGPSLVYEGRIDDSYPALGAPRRLARHHELEDVLDALVAGKPLAFKSTPAVGCTIPRT